MIDVTQHMKVDQNMNQETTKISDKNERNLQHRCEERYEHSRAHTGMTCEFSPQYCPLVTVIDLVA